MVESIEDDTCDELNWQKFEGKFPISNSCGQEGRSYQDENCVLGTTEFLSCDVDADMQINAVTSGSQERAPPPLKCHPGTGKGNYAGYYDTSSGREVMGAEYVNVAGRTDVEGEELNIQIILFSDTINTSYLSYLYLHVRRLLLVGPRSSSD